MEELKNEIKRLIAEEESDCVVGEGGAKHQSEYGLGREDALKEVLALINLHTY